MFFKFWIQNDRFIFDFFYAVKLCLIVFNLHFLKLEAVYQEEPREDVYQKPHTAIPGHVSREERGNTTTFNFIKQKHLQTNYMFQTCCTVVFYDLDL